MQVAFGRRTSVEGADDSRATNNLPAGSPEAALEAVRSGAQDFLVKSAFDVAVLMDRVRKRLGVEEEMKPGW